ncbi:MAG: NAD(P)H-dependent glycerol-3-phosphate dehydrogenase [Bacteroidetes bacterium CG12_big_fil_rev_8_21_14_0_65_60_17]|nr:MAG: NAD(P)H-dependent glycerol-3-phosphate dehydrogenase [Bacteroidetes bacterium CG12_big_fil_rev_8_21_14_0_65_60_17]
MSERIAVIGSGSFGTALAISLSDSGHDVTLWARREEMAAEMSVTRRNPSYLPDAVLPNDILISSDLEQLVSQADIWVFATPSQVVRQVAARIGHMATETHVVVSVAKGIENGTLLTTSCVLDEALPAVPLDNIVVLYGPSHAEEVVRRVPTAVVAAGYDMAVAERIQRVFMSPSLRVYVSPDVRGVEIAGSVKNILAVAAGISDGVGFGDNAKAALLTRGIAEIRRLGVALGAHPRTFAGLAGIGDLVVTCMSGLSRNRHFGQEIGRGKTLEQVESEMTMVAEGVRTTASVHDLAQKLGVDMPITEAVYCILFKGKLPLEAVSDLMTRSAKQEDWLTAEEP